MPTCIFCFHRNAYGYVYCSPALLPHGFFAAWCLNLGLNVGWLFLWDRRCAPKTPFSTHNYRKRHRMSLCSLSRLMAGALVFLILVALTNYVMIFYSCHSLHIYGAWLSKYHKVDLWLHRALVSKDISDYVYGVMSRVQWDDGVCPLQVQNGIAIYATWTTVASLVNLSIVLVKDAKMSPEDAVTLSFSLLTVVLLVWWVTGKTAENVVGFSLEQSTDGFSAGSSWRILSWTNTWGTSSPFTPPSSGPWRGCSPRTTTPQSPPAITSSTVRKKESFMTAAYVF